MTKIQIKESDRICFAIVYKNMTNYMFPQYARDIFAIKSLCGSVNPIVNHEVYVTCDDCKEILDR